MIKVTINGNIGTDIEQDETRGGTKTASFRLASNDRRFNGESKEWEDKGSTSWVNVTAYGTRADEVLKFSKGDLVVITGHQEVRDFERKDGSHGTAVEVTVNSIKNQLGADEPDAE